MEMMEDVVIVGAGIAGLATAVALKRGCGVREIRRAKSHRGYVTNVSAGDVQQVHFRMANNGGDGQGIRTVHRKVLLEALAEELPVDSIQFSSKLAVIESEEQGGASIVVIHLEDGTTIKSTVLIGCDGVNSVVARWLGLVKIGGGAYLGILTGLAEPVHSGRSAVRGLAVFSQGHGFKQEVHQFVDAGKRAGFVPLNDRELYWFLTYNGDNMPGDPEQIQKQVLEKYAEKFPSSYLDVVRHADLSTLTWASLKFRQPWGIIFGKLSKGNVTVAGDAMHPMTPDLGQGGGSSLEDTVVLGRHIGNSFINNGGLIVPGDMAKAIDDYVKERRWRAAFLVTGSYLAGWVQLGGDKWWVKFLRDGIFYKYLFGRISGLVHKDCGKLPAMSFGDMDHSGKKD
ncbi:hypothetical protein POTOM_058811 [Populus tomentosa]|uniref:FAD-binding domain-containing protein n=1 Tax=Populus tomentosa TaxID=118781 RepID=A0A8X7XV13_POPTO|nr:hypothetical protein POTOM_058811 [Populus tomentosa]